jgi:hypothetical protein
VPAITSTHGLLQHVTSLQVLPSDANEGELSVATAGLHIIRCCNKLCTPGHPCFLCMCLQVLSGDANEGELSVAKHYRDIASS